MNDKIGKPKPIRERRSKKNTLRGICSECGQIWESRPSHMDGCSGSGKVISVRKYRSENHLFEEALDELCRNITIWRDGCLCVIDTHECNGESQWGHVVPQGRSNYLKHNLSNSFRQCRGHNGIHRYIQAPYFLWYQKKFGKRAFEELENARLSFPVYKWRTVDMQERLTAYNKLWKNRYSFSGKPIEILVSEGYYGDIIKTAWKKEGRI